MMLDLISNNDENELPPNYSLGGFMGDARRTYADVAARGNTTMTTDNVPFNYSDREWLKRARGKPISLMYPPIVWNIWAP